MKDLSKVTTAYTHGSVFHADDVFAAVLLSMLIPEIDMIRTNDQKLAAEMDMREDTIVFDIGLGEYDHHQKNAATRPEEDGLYFDKSNNICCIPYSSVGLLWRDYGRQLCPDEIAWKKVDKELILPIDKCDNGIDRNSISGMISKFNPNWDDDCSDRNRDFKFSHAVNVATSVMGEYIKNANSSARAAKAIDEHSTVIDDSILVLDKYIPWQETVIETMPDIQFVIFPSSRNPGRYNIQTVPEEEGSFTGRKLFPTEWLGNTNDELGITFCHVGNFLTECVDLAHAIKCAMIAIAS